MPLMDMILFSSSVAVFQSIHFSDIHVAEMNSYTTQPKRIDHLMAKYRSLGTRQVVIPATTHKIHKKMQLNKNG